MKLTYAIAAAAALMIGGSAQAAVTYNLQQISSISGVTGSFSLTTPDFFKTNTPVPTSLFTSCIVNNPVGAACGPSQSFQPDTSVLLSTKVDSYDAVSFISNQGPSAVDYFANGALGQVGTYSSLVLGASQAAILTVTGSPDISAAVPEAATWAMMMLGLGLVGATLRQRRPQQRTTVRFA